VKVWSPLTILAFTIPLIVGIASVSCSALADAPTAAEQWVLDQINGGKAADLDVFCNTPAGQVSAAGGPEACRVLSGAFVERLLTGKTLPADHWPHGGLEIQAAQIEGDVNLSGSSLPGRVSLNNSIVDGSVTLDDVNFDHSLDLECNVFASDVSGTGVHVGGDLSLRASRFLKAIDLVGSKIGGFLLAGGASFYQRLQLGNANIGLTLSLGHIAASRCRRSRLDRADIAVSAPEGVALDATTIGGNLLMEGDYDNGPEASDDAISANAANVHGRVGIAARVYGSTDLRNLVVGDYLNLSSSDFSGPVKAHSLTVAHDATLGGARFRKGIDISNSTIGGTLDLRESQWASDIPGYRTNSIDLRNAHVGRLADDARAWPGDYHLVGFAYGSLLPDATAQPRDWRRLWLEQDKDEERGFEPQLYRQLGSVVTDSGDRDQGNEIQYWARQRQRHAAANSGNWATYAELTLLDYTVGYGIGNYTFRVLWWVVGFTLLGALVLRSSPVARKKGLAWRIQASLDRLLPIVALSPEFEEFFKDPEQSQLAGWQVSFFAAVAIVGWALGLFLAAAMSGLTQTA
jgi:hypothetical protein